jgi:hypothetical protein
MTSSGLFVYRVISDTTNESLPEAFFSSEEAITKAKTLKDASKGKLDFRVVKTIPVYSTRAAQDIAQDDLF